MQHILFSPRRKHNQQRDFPPMEGDAGRKPALHRQPLLSPIRASGDTLAPIELKGRRILSAPAGLDQAVLSASDGHGQHARRPNRRQHGRWVLTTCWTGTGGRTKPHGGSISGSRRSLRKNCSTNTRRSRDLGSYNPLAAPPRRRCIGTPFRSRRPICAAEKT